MTGAHPNSILHHVRHLIGSASATALTDGQLLGQFLGAGDKTAFEVLVRRYGSLVLGVCRRVLHNTQAAEDAFQATFLVLVRKAPSLDGRRPLGSWLYTVAYRLALRARANECRRQRCEEQAARNRPPTADGDASPSDLMVALDEELHRLPERHRAPLVLCYLEGKTNEQAAAILGCPRGSMAARLAEARERLRECLARRGFEAPAAGLAAALTAATAPAAVPPALLQITARAALWFARPEACAAGLVSARAIALARGTFRAMFLNRLKIAGALLLVVVMLGTGTTMLLKAAPPAPAGDPPPPRAQPRPADAPGAAPDRGANAAVSYGQAFVALRRGTGDPRKLSAECLTMPLDDHARQLVARGAYALRMMRRGAAAPRCDWTVPPDRGIDISFTNADGALLLSSLACLRTRLRFEEGQNTEAVEDLGAALTLARHVSRDGTLDGLRAGYQAERRGGEALALALPRLDARTIKDVKARLDALPARGGAGKPTLRMEETLLDWIVGEVGEAKDKESLLDLLGQLAAGPKDPEKRRAEGRACLAACGGTAEGVLKYAREMRPGGARLAKTLDLAPDQVAKEFEREEKKLADNPVYKLFAPVLHNMRSLQAQADVRRALLLAALAVQRDGRGALKDHPDPVVGGPFEYVAFEGGFELRSKWQLEEKVRTKWKLDSPEPLVLVVGRREK